MKYYRRPMEHQRLSVEMLAEHRQSSVFNEPGTGKTKVAVDLSRMRSKFDGVKYVLIVAPFCSLWQWQEEIKKDSPFTSVVLHGSVRERLALLNEKAKFFIINYEGITIEPIFKALSRQGFGMIVFDESIKLKNWMAKRTRAAFALARLADIQYAEQAGKKWADKFVPANIIIMSGKPITSSALDIFGQFWVLDGGETFGRNFYRFRNKYFRKTGSRFAKWVPKAGAMDELRLRMHSHGVAYKKSECLDLPDKVFKTLNVSLAKDQIRAIKDLSGPAIVRIQKKQQITGGFLYGAGGNRGTVFRFKQNPKAQLAKEILEEELFGERVVLVCRYHYELDLLRSMVDSIRPKASVEISGRTNSAIEAAKFFKEVDKYQYAIVQISTGSLALNLHTAHNMIFYSVNYKLDDYEQCQDRIHRKGQNHTCNYINLVARDSIDENIMIAIRKKKNISDFLMSLEKEND